MKNVVPVSENESNGIEICVLLKGGLVGILCPFQYRISETGVP